MTDRISSGTAVQTRGVERTPVEHSKSAKSDALKQREATHEHGAQLRTHHRAPISRTGAKASNANTRNTGIDSAGGRKAAQGTKKEGGFFQRHFGKKSPPPQSARQQARTDRHDRLAALGPKLEQHKRDYQQARVLDQAPQQAAVNLRGGSLRASVKETGKEQVDVAAYKPSEHGMRDRLQALEQIAKQTALGKEVRLVSPHADKPALPQRSAILVGGNRSFFAQAGAKFKDLMLHIFRPQKWQERQVALSEASKAELTKLKDNHAVLMERANERIEKAEKKLEANAAKIEASKERLVERKGAEASAPQRLQKAASDPYTSDPKMLDDPDYVRERVDLLEGLLGQRKEAENAALDKTRAKFDEQQRVQTEPAPPIPAPRRPAQTEL